MTTVLVAALLAAMTWQVHPSAVLTPGPAGAWDAGDIQMGGVAKVGDHYLMIFAGRAAGSPSHGENSIGAAVSFDGVNWFEYAGNPVMGPDARGPCLLYDPADEAAPYKMWYGRWHEEGGANEIRLATSKDGLHWKDAGHALGPGPAGTYDESEVMHPAAVRAGGKYYLYYDAIAKTGTVPPPERCVAVATSTDAIHWTRAGVALKPAGGTALDYNVGDPEVVVRDGQFVMFYKGIAAADTKGVRERICVATSSDGLTFTRCAGNPILSPSTDPEKFPHDSMFGPCAVWDGSRFQVWFGGPNAGKAIGFGYAVSTPRAKP